MFEDGRAPGAYERRTHRASSSSSSSLSWPLVDGDNGDGDGDGDDDDDDDRERRRSKGKIKEGMDEKKTSETRFNSLSGHEIGLGWVVR